MSDTTAPTLARPVQPAADTVEHLIVRAGAELFALPGGCVREVTRWRAPTPVPGAPAVLPGVISQRGVVMPVVDLRLVLGLPAAPPDRATRLVIARHEPVDLALLVDAVLDLAPLATRLLTPPPAALDPEQARLLVAVTRHDNHPLGLIDPGALIAALQEGL